MSVATPAWLSQRGGAVRTVTGGKWLVLFDDNPQYTLTPVPVGGKHGCDIRQTINGRRVESTGTFATAEEAVAAGLEDLRKALGW
jgi:hypothetical protein